MRNIQSLDSPGSVVGVRIDIDGRLDFDNEILYEFRHKAHKPTLDHLASNGAKCVVFAHQTDQESVLEDNLQKHIDIFRSILDHPIVYENENDLTVDENINQLDNGEILILSDVYENYIQNYAEINTVDKSLNHSFVSQFSNKLDAYVNDAFSLSHTFCPTIVGLPQTVPSYAGKVLLGEINMLDQVIDMEKKHTFVIGGYTDIKEKITRIEVLLQSDTISVDMFLLTGDIANIFLFADGYDLGEDTREKLRDDDTWQCVNQASEILLNYREKIQLPNDLIIENNTKRAEYSLSACPLNAEVKDIGSGTIADYTDHLTDTDSVFMCGCSGVIFDEHSELYKEGTVSLLDAVSDVQNSIIFDQNLVYYSLVSDISGFSHSSSGSMSVLEYVTKGRLNGVEVLLPADN